MPSDKIFVDSKSYESFKQSQGDAAAKYNLYHLGGTDHSGAMSGMGGKHARPVFNGITEEEYFCLKERRKG